MVLIFNFWIDIFWGSLELHSNIIIYMSQIKSNNARFFYGLPYNVFIYLYSVIKVRANFSKVYLTQT